MNAAEHIVEAYFRLRRQCFTLPDHKVAGGNNRQFDILAYNLATQSQYHIEVSVTHQLNWNESSDDLSSSFEKKFFGVPPERESPRSDFKLGKNFFAQIEQAYESVGFLPADVQRVWVCWFLKQADNSKPILLQHHSKGLNDTFQIEVLSLRDYILPELTNAIKTAYYDDEILRTLGLMKQREVQKNSGSPQAKSQ
jgi:hypothetical protein